jgi:hypothetical protein
LSNAEPTPPVAVRRAWGRLSRAGVLPAAAATGAVALALRYALRGAVVDGALWALGGAAAWAAILRWPALQPRLTALLVSLALSICAAEALLCQLTPAVGNAVARVVRARAVGVSYDARGPLEVVADLRRGGVQAYPTIPLRSLVSQAPDGTWVSPVRLGGREAFPLGGISRVHTVLDNETGRYGEYDADEHGFNNPPGAWSGAPVSVVLVGDSFTQGCGVPPDSNLAAHLGRRFPRTVNLGIASSGPLAELGELREYGPILRPRVVIWNYFGNDLIDLDIEKRSLLARYVEPGFRQDLAAHQDELDRQMKAIIDAAAAQELGASARLGRFARFMRLRTLAGVAVNPAPPRPPPDLALFQRVIHEAKVAVESWGGRLWFVYLPSWDRYGRRGPPPDDGRVEVLAAAAREGLTALDLSELFDRQPAPLELFPYRLNGHYSALGYRVAGVELADRLAASGLLADARSAPPGE